MSAQIVVIVAGGACGILAAFWCGQLAQIVMMMGLSQSLEYVTYAAIRSHFVFAIGKAMDNDTKDIIDRLVRDKVVDMKKNNVPMDEAIRVSGAKYEVVDQIYRGTDKTADARAKREAAEVKEREKV
jgi:hypothetical protein